MQRRPAAGRPSGTDGSDFSYRMVVEPKYKKVGEGKARLKIAMLLQVLVHLIGVLFLILFPTKEGVFNPFTITALALGVIGYLLGELGRRRSQVDYLYVYNGISSFAACISVGVTGTFSKQWRLSKEPEIFIWNLTSVEVYFHCHILFGLLVEFSKAYIVYHLGKNMLPSKKNA